MESAYVQFRHNFKANPRITILVKKENLPAYQKHPICPASAITPPPSEVTTSLPFFLALLDRLTTQVGIPKQYS